MKKRHNILVICSDQHHPLFSGYRGHPVVRTPHLDALAARGAHFTAAYCNSPVCTPSRMSFITGKYVHQIRNWFINVPLDPGEMTWPRRLERSGMRATMLGKMDFCGPYQSGGFGSYRIIERRDAWDPYPRNSPFEPRLAGFTRHVKRRIVLDAGVRADVETDGSNGHDTRFGFYDHDRHVTDWAIDYLRQRASAADDEPWALYVGLLYPHWPYCVPQRYFDLYYPDNIPWPLDARFPNPDLHPELQNFQRAMGFDEPLDREALRRAIAAYCGMITCMDDRIGAILGALREGGMEEDTYVIYTSDHGESLGEHGLFCKQCSYEGSVGVPLIVAGPGIAGDVRVETDVQLVDMYPTILDMAGLEAETDRPGRSWLPLCRGEQQPDRLPFAFSEYHGTFIQQGWFMIKHGPYKYTHYPMQRPTLFDLRDDPHEMRDLAQDPRHEDTRRACEAMLRSVCDPEAVARASKQDLGLIGPDGEDYTLTLSAQALRQGRASGRFAPEPGTIAPTEGNER